jgi:cytochrome c oxidase assembly protein subunit 15
MNTLLQSAASPWPHRWAVVLACATFPLLWVGGLVTTTDAGMAVPDWPTTFGYNLFLYPWQSWLAGPWDLFVEHGHRLLGAAVGMLTIGLVIALGRAEERRWLRGLGLAALALVVFQGVLGGLRVLLDERVLAMLHGCTGPLFFALAVAIAVCTSQQWRSANSQAASPSLGAGDRSAGALASARTDHVRRLAVVTCVLVYLQLVLGAVLRHVPVVSEPATFALAVRFHLLMAAVLTLHVALLVWSVTRHAQCVRPLHRLVLLLGGLLAVQLALGAATWIVKFSVPVWAAAWWPWPGFTVQAGGWLQTHVITAHVAVGSLLLATATAAALLAMRLLPPRTTIQPTLPARAGLAT